MTNGSMQKKEEAVQWARLTCRWCCIRLLVSICMTGHTTLSMSPETLCWYTAAWCTAVSAGSWPSLQSSEHTHQILERGTGIKPPVAELRPVA